MTPTNPYSGREYRLVVEALQLCTRLERRLIFAELDREPELIYVLDRIAEKAQARWLRRQEKLLELWKEVTQ